MSSALCGCGDELSSPVNEQADASGTTANTETGATETGGTETEHTETGHTETGNTETPVDLSMAALEGGLEGFGTAHAKEQGYWYSRYNLGSLVMKSGAGEPFMPDMEMMPDLMMMVSDELSSVAPPSSPALLMRVHNTATPEYKRHRPSRPSS